MSKKTKTDYERGLDVGFTTAKIYAMMEIDRRVTSPRIRARLSHYLDTLNFEDCEHTFSTVDDPEPEEPTLD